MIPLHVLQLTVRKPLSLPACLLLVTPSEQIVGLIVNHFCASSVKRNNKAIQHPSWGLGLPEHPTGFMKALCTGGRDSLIRLSTCVSQGIKSSHHLSATTLLFRYRSPYPFTVGCLICYGKLDPTLTKILCFTLLLSQPAVERWCPDICVFLQCAHWCCAVKMMRKTGSATPRG